MNLPTGTGGVARVPALTGIIVFLVLLLVLLLTILPVPVHAVTDLSPEPPALFPAPVHAQPGEISYPFIAGSGMNGTLSRSYEVPVPPGNVTVSADADLAVYTGARNGTKFAVAPPGTTVEALAPGYYTAFIADPRQDGFFASLIGGLRTVRGSHGLSDDGYLGFVTDFVQGLPYDVQADADPETPARFPVETFVDGTGSCEDKSLLLAGLLSREGYDVALLFFVPEHHMAVGVRNRTVAGFMGTGYLYVETTGPALIGAVPSRLGNSGGGNATAAGAISTPIVIRVGNGTKEYTDAGRVAEILADRNEADRMIALLRPQVAGCVAGSGGGAPGGNDGCNRTLVAEYDRYARIHNYIVAHVFEQAGMLPGLSRVIGSGSGAGPYVPGCFSGTGQSLLSGPWQELWERFGALGSD